MQSKGAVVLTGGTGFLGSHVKKALIARGYSVIEPKVNLCSEVTIEGKDFGNAEAMIHCAGLVGGIKLNQDRPADMLEVNVRMGLNALALARDSGIERFVNISSTCAYPDLRPLGGKGIPETVLWEGRPEEGNAPYGISKRVVMEAVDSYRKQFGMVGVNLVLANLYGPNSRQDDNSHVIPALVKRFVEAKDKGMSEVVVWGTGEAEREFLHVNDAARAVVDIGMNYMATEPVNVGSGHTIRIKDLVQMIKEIVGFEGDVVWDPSKPDSRTRRLLDSSTALAMKWSPMVNFRDGIKEMVLSVPVAA